MYIYTDNVRAIATSIVATIEVAMALASKLHTVTNLYLEWLLVGELENAA